MLRVLLLDGARGEVFDGPSRALGYALSAALTPHIATPDQVSVPPATVGLYKVAFWAKKKKMPD